MLARDFLRFCLGAVVAHRARSLLTVTGIAIGIAAVVLLTAIGEGIHHFILTEFSQFGTRIIAVAPGKVSTLGLSGAILHNVRPLSLADAQALARVPGVEAVVPVTQGNAEVEGNGRTRRSLVIGASSQVPAVWLMQPELGRFLPDEGAGNEGGRALAVLGAKLRAELFGDASPLGARIRIGGEPYRVIGVMASKGQMLGFDLDDTVYIPVARAMALFNRDSLFEIDLLYGPEASSVTMADRIRQALLERHGHEDFTVTTQDQMLEVAGSVLNVLTLAVGAIGGISLAVGGIGILTIMTIAVRERRREIGLLRALGAAQGQILLLFLGEAMILALLGGLAGLALGLGGAGLMGILVASLPTHIAWEFALAAVASAGLIGLAAGVLPALRAARLDPILALRDE
ncbi:MAG: ABC transporter permease [Gammaproteobacteria bacterium]|jgi:putative ABC transport system permease protein|nr:MAG: ABC transporter permease [Gammaproteobacteria bacterium]